ncbi:MAG: PD-(D/E)XK nuclease family protein [Flavobacteriales bacterium]
MSSFLEKTAQHLIQTYDSSLSECCIVLPNKRAGLFLKQQLSKLIDKPIWLPPIIGAEDLIEDLSKTEIIDNLTQLFELYEVYTKIEKQPENFEEFSKWGQILLHDFNEIDRYLIPTEPFFKTINDVRAIEVWNLGEHELSEMQLNYLAFWKQMGTLYEGFHQHLLKHNKAFQGKAFRIVAEKILGNPKDFIENNIVWKKIIFVGFNALTLAEETIITELKKHGKAEILWDADEYYLNDSLQESGMFLREFKKKEIFTPFNWVTDKFKAEQKNINIVGIPQSIGQAKYLSTIFKEINSQNNYKDTSVVLAEESLLVPVLESIPSEISSINVTMGYPIKNAPLSNFFEIYFNTLLNANRFGKSIQLTYHYKDLNKLLQLPFAQIVFGEENCKKVLAHIIQHNWVFINKEKLDVINNMLPFQLFATYTLEQTLKHCLAFIEQGKNHYSENLTIHEEAKLELEYLFHFSKLFNQIKLLSSKYQVIEGVKTFITIYRQLLSNLTIELYGEPLQGLQVMGMLETRNIDFKNVILLSTNEGILPSGKTFNSFIPFDIKRAFNLPTHIEKDAVYAYHFYRLVQNAENIYILYNTETNEFGSGEKSRFVTQIENELVDYPNITINDKIITYPAVTKGFEQYKIEKSEQVLAKIVEFFERGVSPSALNTFMNCPLDFYYKYVLRINEVDEVEETVEVSTFGTVIHNVLETLYKPFLEKKLVLTATDVEKMKGRVEELTVAAFIAEKFSVNDLKSGKNLITFNIALDYINSFLKNELRFLNTEKPQLLIKHLEKEFRYHLDFNQTKVLLKGKADRVDSFGSTVRILDYKTGTVDAKDLKINDLENVLDKQKAKAFQVLFYAYLYSKESDASNIALNSGIVALKKKNDIYLPFMLAKEEKITPELLTDFEKVLIYLFNEMIDVSKPFTHNKDAKYCLYCN